MINMVILTTFTNTRFVMESGTARVSEVGALYQNGKRERCRKQQITPSALGWGTTICEWVDMHDVRIYLRPLQVKEFFS